MPSSSWTRRHAGSPGRSGRATVVVAAVIGLIIAALPAQQATAGTAPSARPPTGPVHAGLGRVLTRSRATDAKKRRARRPGPITKLRVEDFGSEFAVHWTNPRPGSFTRIVLRLERGSRAASSPAQGRVIRPASARARTATMRGLARDTEYTLAVWTRNRRGRLSRSVHETFTTDAAPPAPGRYRGLVRDTYGHPLRHAEVDATVFRDNNFLSVSTRTDRAGRFTLTLPPGDAFVFVDGTTGVGGRSDATGYQGGYVTPTIRSQRTLTHVFTLLPGGELTGRAVDSAGRPLEGVGYSVLGIEPYVQDANGFSGFFENESGPTLTGPDGTFELRGLDPEAVRVCLDPTAGPARAAGDAAAATLAAASSPDGYAARCTSRSYATAPRQRIPVPPIALTTTAGVSGVLRGVVRGASGRRLGNAEVTAEPVVTSHSKEPDIPESDVATDSSGGYSVTLSPGTYRVCAAGQSVTTPLRPTGYAPACGPKVRVSAASATTVPTLRLPDGAALTGTVRGPNGRRLANVDVEAGQAHDALDAQDGDGEAGSDVTDARGQYRIVGLRPGRLHVCFAPEAGAPGGGPTGALPGCYKHATIVTARRDMIRTGLDGHLAAAGAISGVVRDSTGRPARYAEIVAQSFSDSPDDDSLYFGNAQADAAGRFTVRGLPATQYQICASPAPASHTGDNGIIYFGYGIVFNDGPSTSCGNHLVRVHDGRTTRSVNRVVTLPVSVEVTVHDGSGRPLAGVDATALSDCTESQNEDGDCTSVPLAGTTSPVVVDDSEVTDQDGRAWLSGTNAGRFTVCGFGYYAVAAGVQRPLGYADRCTTRNAVRATADRPGHITLVLADAGGITGTVTDSTGRPIAGAAVRVSGSGAEDALDESDDPFDVVDSNDPDPLDPEEAIDENPSADQITGADGSFAVRSVAAGTQTVCVDAESATGPSTEGYLSTCSPDAPPQRSRGGVRVTITAGRTDSGVALHLAAASAISGHVSAGGTPAAEAAVVAFDHLGNVADVVEPTSTGAYTLSGLPAGGYRVCAIVGGRYTPQCWRGVAWDGSQRPSRDATVITTISGAGVPGINFDLPRQSRSEKSRSARLLSRIDRR